MNSVVHFAPSERPGAVNVAAAGAGVAEFHRCFVFYLVRVPTLSVLDFRAALFNLKVLGLKVWGLSLRFVLQSSGLAARVLVDVTN